MDQYGQVIDVLLSERRNTAAARRFFTRALAHGPASVEVTTDKAGPYPRVLDELVPAAAHVTEQGPMRLRWAYCHLTSEHDRHNGHADLLRERIDGSTGT